MTRPWVGALVALSLALGVVYISIVPPGLPYDEPSHWSTVMYYVDHDRIPVLGDPGVTYEGQMGPVAYAIDAVVVRIARAVHISESGAFDLVRFLGLLELAAATVLIMRLVRRGVPVAAGFAVGAVAVFALNPMLLTMSASVQNDTLALALGLGSLELALASLSQEARVGRAAIVGMLAGLAVLTKLTAWVLVPSLVAWLLWRHGQRALAACGALVSAVIVVSGWWFVRNLVLYGDLTAAKAVRRTGVTFAPYHVRSVGDLGHVGQEGVTYLWVPTEYLRNTISASSPVKGLVALATVAAVVAAVTSTRARSIFLSLPLLTFCAILSVATWLVTLMTYQAVAPRVAYLALPVWVLIVLAALQRLRSPMIALGGAVAFMLVLNAWALHAISRAPDPGMRITSVRSSVGSRGVSDGRDRNIILGPRAFGEACISFAGVRRGVTR